ncbi:MAG: DNA-formamidopyrimidine glycosylase [Gloeomargaritaceae cyanobacterium C42_A2020_066]|nr:DNA-formamidopyrimidine glycosylase [Gloeomargaritaceae cyanobacterium C42_A2020_066]
MPELPEVEIVRQGLQSCTLALPMAGGVVAHPRSIAHPPDPDRFLAGLVGSHLKCWERRGKYLLGHLVRGGRPAGVWVVHLRMTGQLLWLSQSEPVTSHTRVRLFFPDGQELRFVDQRTFGQMWWVPPDLALSAVIPTLGHLGPEPLGEDCTPAYLAAHLGTRQRPLKTALLDQTLIAGLGNIYADEALFCSRLHPQRPCHSLHPWEWTQLHAAIRRVLTDSLAAGGSTLSHFRHVRGMQGHYKVQAWVYGRTGQPCRQCATPIQRLRLAGRSSHFCPRCQPSVE